MKRIIESIDLFGQPIRLYYNKQTKTGSLLGGLLTIGVIILGLVILSNMLAGWANEQSLSIVPSSISYSSIEIQTLNKTLSYEFTNSNYYAYFVMFADFGNGTRLNHFDLEQYLTLNINYTDQQNLQRQIAYESCYYKYQDLFLGLDASTDFDIQSNWSICLKDPLKMGYYTDGMGPLNLTEIEFSVNICDNSTSTCADLATIQNVMKYVTVQTYIPRTIYDFYNYQNPAKTIYDINEYTIDFLSKKKYINFISPYYLYTDQGLTTEDYRLDRYDFNIDKQSFDLLYRDLTDMKVFSYSLRFSFGIQNNYRKNTKINEIVGSFGGLMNIVLKIANILCFLYNSYYLNHQLINSSFQITHSIKNKSEKEEENKNSNINIQDKDKDKQKEKEKKPAQLKFSFFRYFWANFTSDKNDIYKRALNFLFEFIDLKKIIVKLEEIEKLKLILLDEHQRLLFELVKKPLIGLEVEKKGFRLSKTTSKRNMDSKVTMIYTNMKEKNSEINKRLIDLFDNMDNNNLQRESETNMKETTNEMKGLEKQRKNFDLMSLEINLQESPINQLK